MLPDSSVEVRHQDKLVGRVEPYVARLLLGTEEIVRIEGCGLLKVVSALETLLCRPMHIHELLALRWLHTGSSSSQNRVRELLQEDAKRVDKYGYV